MFPKNNEVLYSNIYLKNLVQGVKGKSDDFITCCQLGRRKSSCLIAGLDLTPARYPHNGKPEELRNENPPGKFTEQLWTCFIDANQYLILNAISNKVLKITNYTEHTKKEPPTNEAQTLWNLFIVQSLICVCALGQCMYSIVSCVSVCMYFLVKSEQHSLQKIWPSMVMIM